MRLGRYLIDSGVCTAAQIDQAARSRGVFGGRIGTNLVEMGHLEVDQLEQLLARNLGVEAAPERWLTGGDPRVRRSLPVELIEKYLVLPLYLEGMRLHLAMVDPCDRAQIEELQFASGCDVVPYALSEIRMSVLLAYHYDVPCDPRFLNLAPPIEAQPRPARESELGEDLLDEATWGAMAAAYESEGADDQLGSSDS